MLRDFCWVLSVSKASNSATSPHNSFLLLIPHGINPPPPRWKTIHGICKIFVRSKSNIIQSLSISKGQICNKTQGKKHVIWLQLLLATSSTFPGQCKCHHQHESPERTKDHLTFEFWWLIPMGLYISSKADKIYFINIYTACSRSFDFLFHKAQITCIYPQVYRLPLLET